MRSSRTVCISSAVALSITCGGCNVLKGATHIGHVTSPVVQATNGGSATLTIISCARTLEGASMLREVLEMLINYPSAIVSADNGAQSRLVLNGCPFAEVFSTPVGARGRTR